MEMIQIFRGDGPNFHGGYIKICCYLVIEFFSLHSLLTTTLKFVHGTYLPILNLQPHTRLHKELQVRMIQLTQLLVPLLKE